MYNEVANATWLYIAVGIILTLCTLQILIFMKKAYDQAVMLGMDKSLIQKAFPVGFSVSILPALPILITFLTLIPLMGVPIPWMRLTVIGSPMIETIAAQLGVTSVGEEFAVNAYSISAFAAAVFVMSVGGAISILWSVVALKPIDMAYSKTKKFDMKLVNFIGGACMCGVLGFVSADQSTKSTVGALEAFVAAFICSTTITFIHKKFSAKTKWLRDFNMTLGMLVGMAYVCIAH
ncbi:MAG: DUF5058 family protein [Dehalobacterium sp.]